MEETVLGIGGCSGRDTNKFEKFNIPLCRPGWLPLHEQDQEMNDRKVPDNEKEKDSGQQEQTIMAETTRVDRKKAKRKGKQGRGTHTGRRQAQQAKREEENIQIDSLMKDAIAVAPCVAHMECTIVAREEKEGHMLTQCQLQRAWVRAEYWDGKNFLPRTTPPGAPAPPPYLTFLGSQQFAYVYPLHKGDNT